MEEEGRVFDSIDSISRNLFANIPARIRNDEYARLLTETLLIRENKYQQARDIPNREWVK